MIRMLLLLSVCSLCFQVSLYCQSREGNPPPNNIFLELEDTGSGEGRVRITQDEKLYELVSKHVKLNKDAGGVPGYRIRIFSDSGQKARQNAREVRARFLEKYEDIEIYMEYDVPYFKLYAGDCRTKSEAIKLLGKLKRDFPNAFIINDRINVDYQK